MVVFGKIGCIPPKWMYLGKIVLSLQKWLVSGKSGSVREKVVLFEKIECSR